MLVSLVCFGKIAEPEKTPHNSAATELKTYGDLNAVIGKDEGRVGRSELGSRHGDEVCCGVVVEREEKRKGK